MLPPRASSPRGRRRGSALITKIVTALLLVLALSSAVWSSSHSSVGETAAITVTAAPDTESSVVGHPEAGAVWTDVAGAELCLLGALCGLLILALARAWSGRRPRPGLAVIESMLRRVIRASHSLTPPGVSPAVLVVSRT